MATAQYTSLLNSLTTNLDSHLSFFLFIIVLIFIILSPESPVDNLLGIYHRDPQ